MRFVLGCGLAVLLAATGAADDKKDKDKKDKDKKDKKEAVVDAAKLVGKWELAVGMPAGAKVMVEFTKDAKVVLSVAAGGKSEKVEGGYKLDGTKLTITVKRAGQERAEGLRVLKLTDTELVTEDEKGNKDNLRRTK